MGLFGFLRRKPSSPASVPPVSADGPDPGFIGDCLAYCLIDRHFNLPPADLDPLVESVREPLRRFVLFWINIYLCWVLTERIRARHGAPFLAATLDAVRARLEVGGAATADLAGGLQFWFSNLDNACAEQRQTPPVSGVDVPMEMFAAWAFLALTAGSPFFQQRDIPSDVAFEVAFALEGAKTAASGVITTIVEIGRRLNPATM